MAMVWVVAVASTVPGLVKELVGLYRYVLRRASIERMVAMVGPGSRVVDQDGNGNIVEVAVTRPPSLPSTVRRTDR
jgi:hypothetical protein